MPNGNGSAAYLAALEDSKRVHLRKVFTGLFVRPHAPFIKEIVDRLGCRTALDYGCGKGRQYEWVMPLHGTTLEQYWGLPVAKHDPAYPPFAQEPLGPFDLVICTHVLGSIPVTDLGWVVDRLFSLATKAIYISERLTAPRKQIGPRGLRPLGWNAARWREALTRESEVEVTLATRIVDENGGKITSHSRLVDGQWNAVEWPAHVRPLNHSWA